MSNQQNKDQRAEQIADLGDSTQAELDWINRIKSKKAAFQLRLSEITAEQNVTNRALENKEISFAEYRKRTILGIDELGLAIDELKSAI